MEVGCADAPSPGTGKRAGVVGAPESMNQAGQREEESQTGFEALVLETTSVRSRQVLDKPSALARRDRVEHEFQHGQVKGIVAWPHRDPVKNADPRSIDNNVGAVEIR